MKLLIMQNFLSSSYFVSSCPEHPFLRYRQCILLPKILVCNYLSLYIFVELMGRKVLPRLRIAKALIESQDISGGICGGQNCTIVGFHRTLRFYRVSIPRMPHTGSNVNRGCYMVLCQTGASVLCQTTASP
jgi:hypothetical protein